MCGRSKYDKNNAKRREPDMGDILVRTLLVAGSRLKQQNYK